MSLRFALVVFVLALSACQSAPARPQVHAFEGELARAAERSGAPGIVAAIYRDGEIVEMFAWGGADCEGNGEANPFAAHEIGSISKHFVAVSILQLRERGLVDLDAPVGTYLDDIPEAWRPVTLRQLLTHTGGAPDYEEAGGYGVYETTPTIEEVFAIVSDRPLDFEPGTRWSYSNTGYFLLSLVVQRVSGQRFGDYLREHIFAPLNLDHTFMGGYQPADVVLAQGCKPGDGDARVPVPPIHESSTFGAGGISSTLEDWAIWDDALQDGRILSAESMQALFTPQRLSDGTDTEYAFGMSIDEFRGLQRRGHNGQTQGFVADYAHFPERGISTMVMANTYGGGILGVSRLLAVRAMPDLSYDRIEAPEQDPERTAVAQRALRQALLAEAPLDLLGDNLRAFATGERFAGTRAGARPLVDNAEGMIYLRSQTSDSGVRRDLWRLMVDGETRYVTLHWEDGLLVGLSSEDE